MTDHILDALKIRLADLERKAAARRGQPGLKANVEEIDAAIAELSDEIAKREAAAES